MKNTLLTSLLLGVVFCQFSLAQQESMAEMSRRLRRERAAKTETQSGKKAEEKIAETKTEEKDKTTTVQTKKVLTNDEVGEAVDTKAHPNQPFVPSTTYLNQPNPNRTNAPAPPPTETEGDRNFRQAQERARQHSQTDRSFDHPTIHPTLAQ